MTQILKVLHLSKQHGMTEVQIGCRRIEPDLDRERFAGLGRALELGPELATPDYVHAALGEIGELLFDGHEQRSGDDDAPALEAPVAIENDPDGLGIQAM